MVNNNFPPYSYLVGHNKMESNVLVAKITFSFATDKKFCSIKHKQTNHITNRTSHLTLNYFIPQK